MTIAIREPRDADFFPWLSLYEAYAAQRGVELTETKALLLWTWLSDPANAERAFIVVSDSGDVTGLVHFHTFPRPLEGDTGVFIDAFHLAPETDDPQAGSALFDAVRDDAATHGSSVLRWTQAEGEQLPAVLSQVGGTPTQPRTFELQAAVQPAAQLV
ncbi:MAG TPA: GNAT family N-acetyltransferase [Gryllotalpicola sp.]